ncbi:hypothetical protein [Caenispirillum salinarum]|uniref:hypothetical protein n=1 Tax=Caenispirillum salinarum TaxID=859058 RepID=UPI00384E6E04
MPPKNNPKKLNPLQLKTLTILQELGNNPQTAMIDELTGDATINQFPHAHGNHFHLGPYVVSGADATGLSNEAVWRALERKGLARSFFPTAITLTQEGRDYETGMRDQILHGSDH